MAALCPCLVMSTIQLREANGEVDAVCMGGVYSDCSYSPVTNTAVYSGSVENQVFFVLNSAGDWTGLPAAARAAVAMDGSVTATAVSIDGTVTACALSPSEEGAELHVIKTPSTGTDEPLSSIKLFTTSVFQIRSVCFGLGGRLKTKIVIGSDEGKIFSVSLSRSKSGAATEVAALSAHGGVKCVRTCPLTGNVAASFCDGYVVLLDSAGAEMESRKIAKKNMTPDSVEKFHIDWHPKLKERLLCIAGRSVPVVLKSGAWGTTPVPEDPPSVDGVISVARWSLDGALIGAVTAAGTIQVYDFSPITGPSLKVRALSANNTIVSMFWGYSGDSHVINAIGLKGGRASITGADAPVLKRELKIDLNSLLSSSKEAAAGNIESGLVEDEVVEPAHAADQVMDEEAVEADSDDSDSSDDSESAAESVDESPEQLQAELNDLIDQPEGEVKTGDLDDGSDDDAVSAHEAHVQSSRSKGQRVTVDRQFSFQPGATVGTKTDNKRNVQRRILCWNQFGSVVRTDFPLAQPTGDPNALNEEGLIEVHLEVDSAPMKQFRLKDNLHGWALASLGNTGLALAVKSRFDISDKYEDDLVEDENKKKKDIDELTGGLSKVCFRPFTSWGNQREWIVPLPLKAEVESVAAGSACVAAIATDSVVRVWSNEGGFLLWSWSLRSEVPVSIAANGELFFVTSVMRSRNTETLQYETFLTQNSGGKLSIVDSGSLPISSTPGAALCWIGVSEDFVPFTCDTQGVIRGLFPLPSVDEVTHRFAWVPLLNFVTDHQRRGEGYWPVCVSERDVWCVPTRAEDDYEPRAAPLPPVAHVALRPQAQYVADKQEPVSIESQLFMDRLVNSQTRFCAQLGLAASAFKTAQDGDFDKIVKKSENLHDKKLADAFRKLLEAGKLEKALGGAALAFQSMTSRLMIRMAAALGMRALEARLEDLFNPVRQFEQAQPSAAATLFPQAGAQRAAARSTPPPEVETQPVARVAEAATAHAAAGPAKQGVVNPFAKKRPNDENSADAANKMARNA